jgi:hypothetical protein
MKKTVVLNLLLLFASICNYSFGNAIPGSPTSDNPSSITTLIINANATIVLIDNERATLEVTGSSYLRNGVTLKEKGDTLVIDATKKRDMKSAGVIYVPASQLKNIRINSEAHVVTFYPLQRPNVDVVVNGACTIEISSVGKLNMIGTPLYSVDQTTEVNRIPKSILQKLNNYY